MSGPRIDLSRFKAGWLLPGGGRVAHHFDRSQDGFKARCGRHFLPKLRDRSGFVALEPGQFPHCKSCAR